MFENIVIDETSVYEIDEACAERCKDKEEENHKAQTLELKLQVL